MVLKVRTRSDEIKRICDCAAERVGSERCCRGYYHQVTCPILLVVLSVVEAENDHEVCLEEVVYGVENAREGYITNQRHL